MAVEVAVLLPMYLLFLFGGFFLGELILIHFRNRIGARYLVWAEPARSGSEVNRFYGNLLETGTVSGIGQNRANPIGLDLPDIVFGLTETASKGLPHSGKIKTYLKEGLRKAGSKVGFDYQEGRDHARLTAPFGGTIFKPKFTFFQETAELRGRGKDALRDKQDKRVRFLWKSHIIEELPADHDHVLPGYRIRMLGWLGINNDFTKNPFINYFPIDFIVNGPRPFPLLTNKVK